LRYLSCVDVLARACLFVLRFLGADYDKSTKLNSTLVTQV
jgi:hypothetical protein